MNIKLNLIDADPDQPRQEFDPADLTKLTESIQKNGILTSLVLEKDYRPGRYLVIDGERRYRCAKKLGLKEVPAILSEKKMNASERMIRRFQLQENHANWSVFDKARAVAFFVKTEKCTSQEVAELLGIGLITVQRWVNILKFSKRAQTRLIERRITVSYIESLSRVIANFALICDIPVPKIEELLIDKIEDRIVGNSVELNLLNRFLNISDDEKAKLKFLNTPSMTVKQLIQDTQEGTSIRLDKVMYACNNVYRVSRACVKMGLSGMLSTVQEEAIDKCIESLNVIKNAPKKGQKV